MLSAPIFLERRSAPAPALKKGGPLPHRSFWKKGVALLHPSFMKRVALSHRSFQKKSKLISVELSTDFLILRSPCIIKEVAH